MTITEAIAKLETVETELVTLHARLAEPFRNNCGQCVQILRDVKDWLKENEGGAK